MRLACSIAIALTLAQTTFAQTRPATDEATEAAAEEAGWEFSLSAYTYIVPDDRDYVQPTFRADRDWLHLEARYNYEDLDTVSFWLGYNLSYSGDFSLDFTPMLGGVFGDTDGIAPGYELTLTWKKLQLYSEAEYVIDCNDTSDSFLYTWTELTYSFTDWFRAGGVIQRTKAYDTDFDIQRGFMAGLTYEDFDFSFYLLNPDDDPIVVVGIAYAF